MSSQGKHRQYRGILGNPISSLRHHNSNTMTFEVWLTIPKAFNNRWRFLRQDYLQARHPGCHPTNRSTMLTENSQHTHKTCECFVHYADEILITETL